MVALMVTVWTLVKVPATGLKVGAVTCEFAEALFGDVALGDEVPGVVVLDRGEFGPVVSGELQLIREKQRRPAKKTGGRNTLLLAIPRLRESMRRTF